MRHFIFALIACIQFTACDTSEPVTRTDPQTPAATEDTILKTSSVEEKPSKSEEVPGLKEEAARYSAYLKRLADPPEVLKASSAKPSTLTAKKGTIIYFDPAAFVTASGKAPKGEIEVEIRELTDHNEFIKYNIPTVSGNRMLVTGGAYYLNAKAGGEQLRLAGKASLKVAFPKLSEEKMELFYAERDSLGTVNWRPTTRAFTSVTRRPPQPAQARQKAETEIVTKESSAKQVLDFLIAKSDSVSGSDSRRTDSIVKQRNAIRKNVYEVMELNQLGWINCDRFYDVPEKTDLLVDIPEEDSLNSAQVFVVFKDIKSAMQMYCLRRGKQMAYNRMDGLPVGQPVRVVAFSIKGKEVYGYSKDLVLKKGQTLSLDLKKTSDAGLKKLLNS